MMLGSRDDLARMPAHLTLFEMIPTAVALFVATNIDDIVLLAVLFANLRLSRRAIVAGQLAGIALLTLASAAVAWAALALPVGALRALGLVPLAMGLVGFVQLWRGADDDDELAGLDGTRSNAAEISQGLGVTLLTVANGADNVAVYVPVFAQHLAFVPLAGATFMLLTGAFCWLGHRCVLQPLLGHALRRYGHIALPAVLVAAGLAILLNPRVRV